MSNYYDRSSLKNGILVSLKAWIDDKLLGKADKATTLSGYGIANAYTKAETDNALPRYEVKNNTLTIFQSGGSGTPLMFKDLKLILENLDWITSDGGKYYTTDISIEGVHDIVSVTVQNFGDLRANDTIQPMIRSEGNSIYLLSSTKTFKESDSYITLRIAYGGVSGGTSYVQDSWEEVSITDYFEPETGVTFSNGSKAYKRGSELLFVLQGTWNGGVSIKKVGTFKKTPYIPQLFAGTTAPPPNESLITFRVNKNDSGLYVYGSSAITSFISSGIIILQQEGN